MDMFVNLSFFWFGVVSAVGLAVILLLLSVRSFWTGAFGLILLFAWTLLTPFSAYDYVALNWLTLLEYVGIYLVAGFAWATVAWVIHLHKQRQQYREVRADLLPKFLTKVGAAELTPDLHEDFRKFLDGNTTARSVMANTRIDKSVLTEQVVLWPLKIIGFFFGDALRILVDGFVAVFGNFFGSIKRRMFREFTELEL